MPSLTDLSAHTWVIGGFIALLTAAFIILFLVPGIRQIFRLNRYADRLDEANAKDLESFSALFADDEILSHRWEEFRDTLHEQKDLDSRGSLNVTAVRQTLPAETYFSEQILVHSPLRTEIFKHLPGILTGIGIIGTFTGLIFGLQAFKVSDDPNAVRDSLNALLQGVHEAFLVSAAAITLAMFVTALEKVLVAALCKRVERLCLILDGKFEAGAGEEYLSRLVLASESSAKEAKQLKQSLVNDLKQILESVAEKQIQAQVNSNAGLAKNIGDAIDLSLRQPLHDITEAVRQVSGNQGDAVNKLLTDTMAAMTAQIRDIFAGQVDGIRGMQQQTIDSLSATVGRLEHLVGEISSRGKETTEAIGSQLAATLTSMEERHRAMNEQTQVLVDTLRNQTTKAHEETSASTQQAIDKMGGAVLDLAGKLQANIESAAIRDEERGKRLADHAAAVSGNASTLTKELIKQTAESVTAMRQAVESMRAGTADAIGKMNLGAADMLRAASEMNRFGETTGTVLQRSQSLVDQLTGASGALTTSAGTLNRVIDDYKTTRDTLAIMVEQLKDTVDNAKKEASLTADILRRIESAAQSLKEAQGQADTYLNGVSEVLTGAHQQFGSQIISTLNTVNGEFHRHVERGARALAGAIDELEQSLDKAGGR